jgi:hypothetical protein
LAAAVRFCSHLRNALRNRNIAETRRSSPAHNSEAATRSSTDISLARGLKLPEIKP